MAKNPVFTLNGGEISPLVEGRADLDKYRSFQRTLNNFIVEPQGAIKRRPGTKIEARLGDVDTFIDSIIEPWIVDREGYFQMLFVNSEIRFFNQNGVQVFTLSIPYVESDFDRLYFRQIYDVMYICHPKYPVKLLSRIDQFVWTIEDAVFNGGPYNTNGDTTSLVQVNEDGAFPDVIITASNPLFLITDIGSSFKIRHPDGISDSGSYSGTTTSAPLNCGGQVVTLTTGGTWDGQIELQLSIDNGTIWQTIGSVSSQSNNNSEIVRDIVEYDALCRVRFTHNGGTIDWSLNVEGAFYNYYEITGFIDENNVNATLISGFEENLADTWEWGKGAFSDTNGYPTCAEIFNERLFLGGVEATPADVYASQTNIWDNFLVSDNDTSPFTFTLNSDIRDRILWFIADQQLIAGTTNSEWTISARNSTAAIAINNINVSRQNDFGSDPVQPIRGDDTTYFVEVGGRRIRSLQYVFDYDSYTSDDMSLLAEHLTRNNKIVKVAFTRTPDKIVWCLLDNGLLITFTTEREQNVGAWSKHPLLANNSTDINKNWDTDIIGQVIDINSVLTESGDVIGMVVQRQDGVYYEVLAPNNNCLDALTTFENISPNDVLALPGNENFTYWDDSFIEKEVPFDGLGSFVRLDIPIADLVILYNGVQLTLGDDYAEVREDLLYWLPDAPDTSFITVMDGSSIVNTADYYTVLATSCLMVQIKPLQNIIETKICYNGVELVYDLEVFAMQGDLQYLIIDPSNGDPDLVTIEVTNALLSNLLNDDADDVLNADNDNIEIDTSTAFALLSEDQYTVTIPRILISVYGDNTSIAYFGLKMYSLAELVDLYNSPNYDSGLGGTRRDVEADLYVYNSVGCDFTTNTNKGIWQRVLFQEQQPTLNESIPLYTGKKKVRNLAGYTTEANIGIRSDSPYCLTVTQIAPWGTKLSSRGSFGR